MSATRILNSFKDLVPTMCMVIREGKPMMLHASELVVGDLIVLAAGSNIPADTRLVEVNGLKVDKSMFTGESEPIKMTIEPIQDETVSFLSASNIAFMGTSVVEGEGKGIVIATGVNNEVRS